MQKNSAITAAEVAKMSVLHPRFVKEQRDVRIRAMRQTGESLQNCGAAFGLTRERVRQICKLTEEHGQ